MDDDDDGPLLCFKSQFESAFFFCQRTASTVGLGSKAASSLNQIEG